MLAFPDIDPAYRIDRELPGGGMANVYLATEVALNRQVVIKVLPSDGGLISLERFKREIATAARLQHPHIVPLLTAGETPDGIPYFIMPYVAGESLRAHLAAHTPMPVDEATWILRDVAQALAFAHDHGVVHRDIKPDNVLLSDGSAVVTDFGIAKALTAAIDTKGGTLTAVGVSLGTPAYMAPEQASADPNVDHRADIYAFGCMAYEMLTGAAPFASRTPAQQFAAHLTEAPAPIQSRRTNLPVPLVALVMKCLEKDPFKRPQSARELLAALNAVTASGSTTATQTPIKLSGRTIAAIAIVLVAAGAFVVARKYMASVAPDQDRSVAVLPFENAAHDSTQEYFSDGLTDELISRLATTGLRVAGRNSVFTFKGTRPVPRAVGNALNVGTVLTGTVRRLGDKLHVSAELASAIDNGVLWTFNTDRQTSDIFAVQRDIVDSILAHFSLVRTPAHVDGTKSVAAHDHYLKGRFLAQNGTKDGLLASLDEFTGALAVDSNYALAYTGIADSWEWLSDGYLTPTTAMPRAALAVHRAMQLDSTLSEVWSAEANLNIQYDWDWPRARREVDRALAINPNDPDALLADAYIWISQGNRAQAMKSLDKAESSDPLSAPMALQILFHRAWSDHPETAVSWYNNSVLHTGTFEYGDSFLGAAQVKLGQFALAETTFKKAEPILGHRSPGLGVLYARTGRRDKALAVLNDIDTHWPGTYIPPELVAQIPAALGDTTGMYRWLERGVEVRSAWAALLGVWDPILSSHRTEPHYIDIMRRVGIK